MNKDSLSLKNNNEKRICTVSMKSAIAHLDNNITVFHKYYFVRFHWQFQGQRFQLFLGGNDISSDAMS